MLTVVFCSVAPCSFLGGYQHFGETGHFNPQSMYMDGHREL